MGKEYNIKERFDTNLAVAQQLVDKYNDLNKVIHEKTNELNELNREKINLEVQLKVFEGILNELRPYLPEETVDEKPLASSAVN